MSNTTARTDIIARIAGEIDDALRPAVALDCGDFAALLTVDQAAAARQLRALTAPQLALQAQAYASYLNGKYAGTDTRHDYTGAEILENFQRAMARHTSEPSAPAPEAAAEHIAPETPVTFSADATIETSSESIMNETNETPAPIATIRTLADYNPAIVATLRLALILHHDAPQFTRALDKFIATGATTPFLFDGHTLAIASQSESGKTIITDGAACTCRGATHAHCYHRAGQQLVLLLETLSDPHGLPAPVFAAPMELAA